MSFHTFRKYEKPALMAAVIFTVAVFVFFPSFGDMSSIFGGGETADADLAGQFTVATTGETRRVSNDEFWRTRQVLAKVTGNRNIEDEDVWAELMFRADAEGAGLEVTDADLTQVIRNQLQSASGGAPITPAFYDQYLKFRGFTSKREYEQALSELLLSAEWRNMVVTNALTLDADQVYEQWKGANEEFDFRVAVIPSVEADDVPDPGDAVLEEYFDGLSTSLRGALFSTPAKKDIVYAWRSLDAPLDGIPEEARATLPEVTDAQVDAWFRQVGAARFPEPEAGDDEAESDDTAAADDEHAGHDHDGDGLADDGSTRQATDEQRAALRVELNNMAAVAAAASELRAAADPETGISKDAFEAGAEKWGLQLADPEGLLGTEGLEALDVVGNSRLPSRLRTLGAGELHQLRPFQPDESVSFMALVEESQDPEPLSFDDARDKVLENWRSTQVDRDAKAFMDALVEAARAREEAQEGLAEIMEGVQARVAERLEANAEALAAVGDDGEPLNDIEPLDPEVVEAEELEAAQAEIDALVLPLRHLVFEDVAAAQGAELLSFDGVPRSYNLSPDEDEDPESIAAFVKRGRGDAFRLDVDQVSARPQFHPNSNSWLVVEVVGKAFPPKSAMLADDEGMERARTQAQNVEWQLFQLELSPAAISQAHGLRLPERADADTSADAGEVPAGT